MKTPQQMLDATKRLQYVSKEVLAEMPTKTTDAPLQFFKLDRYVTDDELEKEYESRGMIAAYPYTLLDYKNDDDLDSKEHVATHWKDSKGNWCFVTFCCCYGRREVSVDRYDIDWDGHWWFAGVRKSDLEHSDTQNSLDTSSLELTLEKALKVVIDAGYFVYNYLIA